MASNGMHVVPGDEGPWDVDEFTPEDLDPEDLEGSDDADVEGLDLDREWSLPDDPQPDSQGEDPFVSEIGDEGQGDLSPEDY